MDLIMPGFTRFPTEGAVLGRLLAGYGELEFEMGRCLGVAKHCDNEAGVRELFAKRGELDRIRRARAAMQPVFEAEGLGRECKAALDDMDWCRCLRNQYAHCTWYDTPHEGLGFVDLEKIVGVPGPLMTHRKMLDLALLQEQETFFRYVQRCFWFLEEELDVRKGRWKHGRIHDTSPPPPKRPAMYV
jgi:hypothetical protein